MFWWSMVVVFDIFSYVAGDFISGVFYDKCLDKLMSSLCNVQVKH